MTIPEAIAAYPALMKYIETANACTQWCKQLREDENAALGGRLAEIAANMEKAQRDYADAAKLAGRSPFPYNRDMGEFLGLPIYPGNGEPGRGYYMACQVMTHHKLGASRRQAQTLIAEGAPLRIVTGRNQCNNYAVPMQPFYSERASVRFPVCEQFHFNKAIRADA